MPPHPKALGLTDLQLRTVLDLAKPLAPAARTDFLKAVVEALADASGTDFVYNNEIDVHEVKRSVGTEPTRELEVEGSVRGQLS